MNESFLHLVPRTASQLAFETRKQNKLNKHFNYTTTEEEGKGLENTYVDGFQKPIRWPNSRVQMRDQEAAVQQTSHSWLNLALTSLYYVHSCAKQRPDSCPPEVKPQATPHENHL